MGKTRIQSFFPFLQTLYDTYNLFVKVHNPACYNTLFTQIKKKALAIDRKCFISFVVKTGLEPWTSRLCVFSSNIS